MANENQKPTAPAQDQQAENAVTRLTEERAAAAEAAKKGPTR